MRVCLCGLTGFCNSVVKGLLQSVIVKEITVFTRTERKPFPYYKEIELKELCRLNRIPVNVDHSFKSPKTFRLIKKMRPDLLLVATFDQLIPEKIYNLPRLGAVNIHPSLLPKFRGTTPTHWAIIAGAKVSGITFHRLSKNFDCGDVLMQCRLPIGNKTDGQLRLALARLAEIMTPVFIKRLHEGKLRVRSQNESLASFFPRITSVAAIELCKKSAWSRCRLARAVTPYPGLPFLKKMETQVTMKR